MKTLIDLYNEHTGKVSDKWALYLSEYDRLFTPYRDAPISMLEIGIQNGGSLEIWSQYFSNAEKFVGCDINPDCQNLSYQDSRISVVVGDATQQETQSKIFEKCKTYDLIIEDGSHTSSDIVKTFAKYFDAVKDGGLFIAEDLHCSYWKEYEGGIFHPYSSINFFKLLADFVNHEHWGVIRPRSELIKGFKEKYKIDIAEHVLEKIHSVEFLNSICIVRKSSSSTLGKRVIAGNNESVVSGHLGISGTKIIPPQQILNNWSILDRSPLESYEGFVNEIKYLNGVIESEQAQVARLAHDINALKNSRSWKYTSGLRKTSSAAIYVKRAPHFLSHALKVHGGYAGLARKTVAVVRREGIKGLIRSLSGTPINSPVITESGELVARNDYRAWIRLHDSLDENTIRRIQDQINAFPRKPKISVVMPVFNAPLTFLEEAIRSVQSQLYEHWELCIADDASTDHRIRSLLESFAQQDARIKVTFRAENGHISAASNSALALATGEFVALLDNDDILPPHALFQIAKTINENPSAALIYSDEDKIDEAGLRYDPYFKCDLNYELLLAQNMICHLGVYRHDILKEIGGFRLGFEGAQDYDLVLRFIEKIQFSQVIHIPKVLYHWRAIPGSTALDSGEKSYAAEAARKAIVEHLVRTGRKAEVFPAPEIPSLNRVRYSLPDELPLVSIIIPTKDRADILSMCLDSLLNKTTYPNFEIVIVDNGSIEEDTKQLLSRQPPERVRVIRDDSPFNYSRLNNLAVLQAKGEFICLMNNDIEIISPDWLEEMLSFATQSEIGCVGARLWYPNGRLQHGGVVLGIGGVAGHSHKHLAKSSAGYFGRAVLHQSMSAVTAACLLVKREIYEQVGGLDEALAVAFNDVDFCLKVRESGFRNVWTPYAEMTHHESVSRGHEDTPEKQRRFRQEIYKILERWGNALASDPAYSPNLTLIYEDFSYSWDRRKKAN